MATDPKITQIIEEDLKNLNDLIDDIAVSLQGKLNANLSNTKDEIQDITKAFKEGKDITKELESNIKRLDKESGKLSLDRKTTESQLKKLIEENNRGYVKGFDKKKQTIEQQLKEIDAQLELNRVTGGYLRLLKDETEERHKSNKLLDQAKNKVSELDKKYTSFAFIWKFLLDAAFKADKQTTELAKSLGIGKDQASKLRDETVKYSRAANDAFVTTDKLLEANTELQQQLGISVKYTDKQAEDFSRLTKLMGLSAEQAGKLARMSIVNGKSIEDTTKSIIKGSAASQRTNRIAVDQREVLKDVSNLSAGILVKFNQNPEALGRAVVEARKLGINLLIN